MNEISNPYFNPSWGSSQVSGFGDSEAEWAWNSNGEMFPSQQQGQPNYGQGVASGLSAGAANSQPIGDFEIDPYAGFKGSVQGMSGGPIGAIIGGVSSQIGQFHNVNKAIRNLDTSVNGVTYDAYGRPVYSGQSIVNSQQNIDALNRGDRTIRNAVDPGTQIFGALAGTRKRIRRKRNQLQANMRQAQTDFNTADVRYRNEFNQRQSYLDNLNNNDRMYNLYRFRS